ncbi:hypothetical protein MUP95_03765, partial [bacterium]|nr:hypothetical protein [bacterium]
MKTKLKINQTVAISLIFATIAYSQIEVSEIKAFRIHQQSVINDTDILSEEQKKIFLENRFACYSPTNWNPETGISPPENSIRQDLKLLKKYFDGIVTYEATHVVPQIASEIGIKYCVLGVWDPLSKNEINIAIEEATRKNSIVISIICGNEGLNRRYSLEQLKDTIHMLKEKTVLPVTTTEESGDYSNPDVISLGDYLAVNAHPYYANKKTPEEAVQFVELVYKQLQEKTNKFVIIKETGLPSGGDVHLN